MEDSAGRFSPGHEAVLQLNVDLGMTLHDACLSHFLTSSDLAQA